MLEIEKNYLENIDAENCQIIIIDIIGEKLKKTPPAVRPVVTILSKSFSSIDHVFAYICDQAGEREPLVLNILHISPLRTSATHRNWQHLGSLSVPIDQRNVPALQFHPAQIEIG